MKIPVADDDEAKVKAKGKTKSKTAAKEYDDDVGAVDVDL